MPPFTASLRLPSRHPFASLHAIPLPPFTTANQLFLWNASEGRLVFANSNTSAHSLCLDIYAGHGPEVDFYSCRRGDNQVCQRD